MVGLVELTPFWAEAKRGGLPTPKSKAVSQAPVPFSRTRKSSLLGGVFLRRHTTLCFFKFPLLPPSRAGSSLDTDTLLSASLGGISTSFGRRSRFPQITQHERLHRGPDRHQVPQPHRCQPHYQHSTARTNAISSMDHSRSRNPTPVSYGVSDRIHTIYRFDLHLLNLSSDNARASMAVFHVVLDVERGVVGVVERSRVQDD